MKRTGIIALMLAAPSSAFGFGFTGYMWDVDSLPLTFYVSDYLEDSLPQTPDATTGLYYQEEVMIQSYCNWHWTEECDELLPDSIPSEGAECAAISYEYGGLVPGHEGPTNDGINKVYFDDPGDDAGSGVNGFMQPRGANILVKQVAGEFIYTMLDADIVFNNNIDWGTTEDIEAGCVGGEMAIESTATHEVGHLWGMGHSCEQEDLCNDGTLLNATMFWTGGPCDTSRASINSDDVGGMTALYGPYASFTTESPRFGAVGLQVCFDLVTEDNITEAEWNFGDCDGDNNDDCTSSELEPCHTYNSQGQFTVNAKLTGLSDTCGEWDFEHRELAYILICDVPDPLFYAEPVEGDDGVVYQMVNETDVSTYGCVDEISWNVYDKQGGELLQSIGAWSPKIRFETEGDYWVELDIGGPAGSALAGLEISAAANTAGGCSTTGNNTAGFAGLLLAFAAMIRRRRS